jgi:hypothetical protein
MFTEIIASSPSFLSVERQFLALRRQFLYASTLGPVAKLIADGDREALNLNIIIRIS